MTGPEQILRRGESCIYAIPIPIPCVRMRVLSAKCQRVLWHSSTALFSPDIPPRFPPRFFTRAPSRMPGIWQSMGALATLSCINILFMQKSHLLYSYLKPGVFLSSKGSYRPGVAIFVLRFIVRRRGEVENSINILRVFGNVLQL